MPSSTHVSGAGGWNSLTPITKWLELVQIVLNPTLNESRANGEPRKIYTPASRFVACLLKQNLLKQNLLVTEIGSDILATTLEPSINLLVWIGTCANTESPNEMHLL